MLYLAIGGLSLAKAIAVRNDPERFRRELRDAALFIGAGLVLRRYGKLKAQKRDDLLEAVPDRVARQLSSEPDTVRSRAERALGNEPEPRSRPSIADRARRVLAD